MKTKLIYAIIFGAAFACLAAASIRNPMQPNENPMADHYKANR